MLSTIACSRMPTWTSSTVARAAALKTMTLTTLSPRPWPTRRVGTPLSLCFAFYSLVGLLVQTHFFRGLCFPILRVCTQGALAATSADAPFPLSTGAQVIGTPVHLSFAPPPPGPPPPLHESRAEDEIQNQGDHLPSVFRAFDFMDGLSSLGGSPTKSLQAHNKPQPPPVAPKTYASRPVPRECSSRGRGRTWARRAAVVEQATDCIISFFSPSFSRAAPKPKRPLGMSQKSHAQ